MERLWELPVSTTVGDAYRLVRRIGEGAQGAVFEARMPFDGERRCALKIMNGALTETAEALAAFQSQAEFASRISHPHLVQLFDFGSDATGQCFLVMEYLEGEDLARRLARVGRLPAPVVSHVIAQVAQGLFALHEHGGAHLDLKPSNVFLQAREGNRDFVKLLDFGTARIDNARLLNHPTALDDTLPYVAPEQASGRTEPLDHRTDQWALACIAWQMLFGRTPFAGPHAPDATSLLYQIVYEDPVPVGDVAGDVPPGVMTVLRRALEKRPDDRFGDINGFVKAFEAMAGTLPPLPERPGASAQAPGAAVWPQAQAPASEPVFLPGMSRREEAQPRRSPTGRKTRMQGLRVPAAPNGAPPSPSAAPDPRAAPTGQAGSLHPSMVSAGDPAPGADRWASLSQPPPAARGWKWLLAAAVPAIIAVIVVSRGGPVGHGAVDVERTSGSPSAPPSPADPAPGEGPLIVPLNAPSPPPAAPIPAKGRHRRQHGEGARAKQAALPNPSHATPPAARTRRGKPRTHASR